MIKNDNSMTHATSEKQKFTQLKQLTKKQTQSIELRYNTCAIKSEVRKLRR